MIIYPAMDLIGGTAVRLKQGRFDLVTAYETDPLEALRQFASAGAEWAHVVDLDGAPAGPRTAARACGMSPSFTRRRATSSSPTSAATACCSGRTWSFTGRSPGGCPTQRSRRPAASP